MECFRNSLKNREKSISSDFVIGSSGKLSIKLRIFVQKLSLAIENTAVDHRPMDTGQPYMQKAGDT